MGNENNNWIIWVIAGILGLAGGAAILGKKDNTTPTSNFTASNSGAEPPKKFGCGCNKGN